MAVKVRARKGVNTPTDRRYLTRKSTPLHQRSFVRKREMMGTTSDMQPLLEPQTLQKGLFGFDDLSSFGESFGTLHLDLQYSITEQMPIINPVFSYKQLTSLYLVSNTLRECIKAYVTNIEGYGHQITYVGPEGRKNSRAAQQEYKMIEALLSVLVENGESLTQARENSRIDKEVTGARAFEVLEDGLGRVVGINRVPTNTLLLTRLEKDPIEVPVYNPAVRGFVNQRRRFRRFCQRDAFGRMVYFKELGDPRPIDPQTGKVNEDLPLEQQATAIYYDAYYTPGTPYGTPQWASCIPSMLGSREAEMVNLSFFRDNGIPAMAVLVSGGALTEESFNKIESYFTDVRGPENHNRIVVLEATPDVSEAAGVDGSIPAPRVDIKPMLSDRQHEGLFGSYIDASSEKIRQSFRLPPIYIGSAEEYNRASAFASIQTAEQQVFVPERLSWDRFMNDVVLAGWNFRFWTVESALPAYNDPQEVTSLLTALGKEGALTPNVCIMLANRYLRTEIETVTEEWGDMPFAVTAAALTAGRKVDGFEYIFEILEGVAQAGVNPNGEEEDEDETSGEEEDENAAIAKSMRKGLRVLFDELAEGGMRDMQTLKAA